MANGARVTLVEASEMTAAFRRNNTIGVISHMYDKQFILDILSQEGCDGIRLYHGKDDGNHVMVLVGTDANGNDMQNGVIVEKGTRCPVICPSVNALNS